MTFGEILQGWSEVTGKQSVYLQTPRKHFDELWGIGGVELSDQLDFGVAVPDWHKDLPFVTQEELGIKAEEVPGLKKTLEGLKSFL